MIAADQPTIFPDDLTVAISSLDDGNMKFEWSDRQDVIDNSREFLNANEIEINQTVNLFISGTSGWQKIRDVTADNNRAEGMLDPQERIEADVLITNTKGLALFLPIADCYGTVMFDVKKRVLALAHLGWQSTEKDMASKTIWHMKHRYDSDPANIKVYFSPAIKKESYVFENPTQRYDPRWRDYLTPTDSGWQVDLLGYNQSRLMDAGVSPQNIESSVVDTASNNSYYSHYASSRDNKTNREGRFAIVAMMR